jgi:hypothetical protein
MDGKGKRQGREGWSEGDRGGLRKREREEDVKAEKGLVSKNQDPSLYTLRATDSLIVHNDDHIPSKRNRFRNRNNNCFTTLPR